MDIFTPAAGFVGLIAFAILYIMLAPDAGKMDLKTKFIIVLLVVLAAAMLSNTVIAVESLKEIDSLRN